MDNKIPVFPWQSGQWANLQGARAQNHLPQALLLSGPAGLGKHQFAQRLAASLLCKEPGPDGDPCGQCRGCHLFQAETHPDYKTIEPEEQGKVIRIDQIREYTSKESLTAQAGGYKVVIVEPADAMNIASSNSLLKTLEEPVNWTLIILVTAKPASLPATIRSRCQRVDFFAPPKEIGETWLKQQQPGVDASLLLNLAFGAPLKALELANPDILALRQQMIGDFMGIMKGQSDQVDVAGRWAKSPLTQTLTWISGWVSDILRLKMSESTSEIINADHRKSLQAIGIKLESKLLFELSDKINLLGRASATQLNTQMQLEALLISFSGRAKT
ncbi:MAG: DNA polymerase III subunit delta' [Gammaproteobacteria bacterium]|nr:DNA polymerase III subunit delta' [Gammaproteobacteria bacterium]